MSPSSFPFSPFLFFLQTNINTDGQLCRFLLGSPSLPSSQICRAQTIQTMNIISVQPRGGICFDNLRLGKDNFSRQLRKILYACHMCHVFYHQKKLFLIDVLVILSRRFMHVISLPPFRPNAIMIMIMPFYALK